jgi:hypothetical protein
MDQNTAESTYLGGTGGAAESVSDVEPVTTFDDGGDHTAPIQGLT